MFKRLFFIVAILSSASASSETWDISNGVRIQPQALDGFKGIKFGMVATELESLGLKCRESDDSDICSTWGRSALTFLGEPAHVSIYIRGGKLGRLLHEANPKTHDLPRLDEIEVQINEPLRQIRSTLEDSLGTPYFLISPNIDTKIASYGGVWIFRNGATLNMPAARYDLKANKVIYRSPERSASDFEQLFRKLELHQFVAPLDGRDI